MKSPKMLERARRGVQFSSGSSARWLYVTGAGILLAGFAFDIGPTASAIQRARVERTALLARSHELEAEINAQEGFSQRAAASVARLSKFASTRSEDQLLTEISRIRDEIERTDHRRVSFVEVSPLAGGDSNASGQATGADVLYAGESTPTPLPTPGGSVPAAAARAVPIPRPNVSPTPDISRVAEQVAHDSFRLRKITLTVHGTAPALLAFVARLRDAGVLVGVGDPDFQNAAFDEQVARVTPASTTSPAPNATATPAPLGMEGGDPILTGQLQLTVYRVVLPTDPTVTPAPARVGMR
jgi:hypothetical protein